MLKSPSSNCFVFFVFPEIVTQQIIIAPHTYYIADDDLRGAIAFGLYRYHKEKVEQKNTDLATIIALSTWNLKSRKSLRNL